MVYAFLYVDVRYKMEKCIFNNSADKSDKDWWYKTYIQDLKDKGTHENIKRLEADRWEYQRLYVYKCLKMNV